MRRRGFTIIELLVVVSIIVALVAILVPTLGAIYKKAYKTQTQALLNNLQTDLAAYYADFKAYPGPVSSLTTSNDTAIRVSGAQNLLLGLSYTFYTSNTSLKTPYKLTDVITTRWVDFDAPYGITDYSVTGPDGKNPTLLPFFNPSPSQISPRNSTTPFYDEAGIKIDNGFGAKNSCTFPVILDAYADAEPILYYRRTPGVPGQMKPNSSVTDSGMVGDKAKNANNPANNVPICAYYYYDNIEYTSAGNIITFSGARYSQLNGGLAGKDTTAINNSMNYLARLACGEESKSLSLDPASLQYRGNPPAAGSTVRGGYILMDAGPDRIYGTADDLVIVGGE